MLISFAQPHIIINTLYTYACTLHIIINIHSINIRDNKKGKKEGLRELLTEPLLQTAT